MYVVARSAKGRPTLMHKLAYRSVDETVCGLDIRYWSRAYSTRSIPQIVCKRCRPPDPR